MSIRFNRKIIATAGGGGGGSNTIVDNKTIVKDASDTITAVGVQPKKGDVLYDWIGTLAEYQEAMDEGKIEPNWLCYITDDVTDGSSKTISSIKAFNLFDTKISDHILEGNEAKGWALQGTYVSGDLYPDFYNKCLEQKTSAIETEVTLGSSTLTMFVNSNGHQFYNISDKSIVDDFYNTFGIADFYGIDEENERIFLPRNKYFQQLTDDVSKVNDMVEAGLPNIKCSFSHVGAWEGFNYPTGSATASGSGGYPQTGSGGGYKTLTIDASIGSSVYGNSDTVQPPSSLKLLYYCVGNTNVEIAYSDITELTSTENDTIPLFTGMYFDFKPSNASWLKAGEQQNSGGIYRGCYNELVKIINGINPYNLQVIEEKNMEADVDYSEYWILDQDNLTFRTPLIAGLYPNNRILVAKKEATADDPTWYNLYSDGWCEQGGQIPSANDIQYTGTLLKPYKDKNYQIGFTTLSNNTSATATQWQFIAIYPITNSTFGCKAINFTRDWRACGYAEVPTISDYTENVSLYFKVANAVQNLELLDAGEVLEAVADVVPKNKSLIVNYAMPSNKYIDLTLGASGTTYIAPTDGYFMLCKVAGSQWYYVELAVLDNEDNYIYGMFTSEYSTSPACVFLPIQKGNKAKITYNATGKTSKFRFIYAKGTEGEV